MAEISAIEWTHATFNPWIGCTKLSAACDHCYAETLSKARLGVPWGAGQPRRRTAASTWKAPLSWNRKAAKEGRRLRVFCASLADVFDAEVPDSWRDELFALIAVTPHLDWLLLTKRPKVMREYVTRIVESKGDTESGAFDKAVQAYLSADQGSLPGASHVAGGSVYHSNGTYLGHDPGHWEYDLTWPLSNVWLGTTVEDQKMADLRIPLLLDTPAAVRFLSMEPLLGPVDLFPFAYKPCANNSDMMMYPDPGSSECCSRCNFTGYSDEIGIDWVITGGESGPGARPTHPDWFRSIRDQCAAAGVPFLFKQWGDWAPISQHPIPAQTGALTEQTITASTDTTRVGRKIFIAGHGPGNASTIMDRVGKKAAGRHLDGVLHDGYPAGR